MSPPDPPLKQLERGFVCPERLPTDDARIAAARNFVERYGRIRPQSRIGERMAARQRLMTKHRCRPETVQHTFPEP